MPPTPTFEQLFDENMGRLWRLSLRLCSTREDAEDLLQEAALIGLRSFERFEAGSNFGAWMGTILVNAHRNRLRADARHVSTVSLDTLSEDGEVGDHLIYERLRAQGKNARRGDPVARLFDGLDGAIIARAFASLAPEFRECCALFWVSELSYEQIAQVLNVPLGTVRSRLHRGRKLLQRELWSLAKERGIVRDEPEGSGTSGSKTNLIGIVFLIGAALGFKMLR
ncbi:sigma-70 family RNA polymerase sigma factor [bacterium]|nr:MAG: sigma-70 family RNA polymerase sigma factor [bacterium]